MLHPLQGLLGTIDNAVSMAADHAHEYVTLEHLTVAVLADPDVRRCLLDLNIDWEKIADGLDAFFNSKFMPSARIQPQMTDDFDEIVHRACSMGMYYAQRPTQPIHLLILILRHRPEGSHAVVTLLNAGLTADMVERYLEGELETVGEGRDSDRPKTASHVDAEKTILRFCANLNEQAKASKIDPLIGRTSEIEDLSQTMCRRTKNNVILVGEPGVGKTAIAEGLALRIVRKDVPSILREAIVYALDVGSLVAGTRFRGEFEERMKALLAALDKVPNAILFIDEIHMIMNAGGSTSSALDVANMLKPALAKGRLRCIGSTTLDEYRKHFENDRALLRRFRRIDISEPSPEDSKLILRGLKTTYEDYHKLKVSNDALDMAVDLSVRYIHKGFLPDKAIDVVDNAFARLKLVEEKERPSMISVDAIEAEVARIARIPKKEISEGETEKLSRLPDDLNAVVFDQDAAVKMLSDAVLVADAGLRDEDKPLGAYLFTGPTGTGKTEVATQLAKTLGVELVRFDMSEYMERHSVSKLIGAPPGYVGFGDGAAGGGLLVNAIDQHPHCVLLLDEIEKAHPDVFNVLLPVMDKARLTNGAGKEVTFRNVLIIMTSNVGATSSSSIGFNAKGNSANVEKAIKATFSPEFRNRLDAIVPFSALSSATVVKIVRKFMRKVEDQASSRNVVLKVTDDAMTWLGEKGFDAEMGARPMARTIAEHVKTPLARLMLLGDLKNGGTANVDLVDGNLVVTA